MQRKDMKTRTRAHRFKRDVHLGPLRTGLRKRNNPQRGHALQREGARTGGHAQRRKCARGRVFGDAATDTVADGFVQTK